MLEVTIFGCDTKSSSFSVVPNHFQQRFFIYLRKSFDAPSEITYVLGLISPHKLRTLAPKWIVQWWKIGRIWWPMMLSVPRDDSISKSLSQELQALCSDVAACSILLKPIFFSCCNMFNVFPYCAFQHFLQVSISIYRSIKPYNDTTGRHRKSIIPKQSITFLPWAS